MDCEICFGKYGDESEDEKPYVIVPCGHSICFKCLSASLLVKCPFCQVKITNYAINWTVLNAIRSSCCNASDDSTSRGLKEELENRVRLIREKKLNTLKKIRDEINIETEKKTQSLRKDAEKLIQQLDESEKNNEVYLNAKKNEIKRFSNMSSPAQLESLGKVKKVYEKLKKVHEELNLFEREAFWYFSNDYLDREMGNKIGTLNRHKNLYKITTFLSRFSDFVFFCLKCILFISFIDFICCNRGQQFLMCLSIFVIYYIIFVKFLKR
jgi:hypothetical protein